MALIALFRSIFGLQDEVRLGAELEVALDAVRDARPPTTPVYVEHATDPMPGNCISTGTSTETDNNPLTRSRTSANRITKVSKKNCRAKNLSLIPNKRCARGIVHHIHHHYHHSGPGKKVDLHQHRLETRAHNLHCLRSLAPSPQIQGEIYETIEIDFHDFAADDDDFVMGEGTELDPYIINDTTHNDNSSNESEEEGMPDLALAQPHIYNPKPEPTPASLYRERRERRAFLCQQKDGMDQTLGLVLWAHLNDGSGVT
ncbi:MAG: hypothetical protein MMC33_006198 [Icmadophila ericetorum]|nr:hypothetical protein [Icmadophila ericetorum]